MCSAVRCDKCGKATWSGCGQHIEEALAGFQKITNLEGGIIAWQSAGYPLVTA